MQAGTHTVRHGARTHSVEHGDGAKRSRPDGSETVGVIANHTHSVEHGFTLIELAIALAVVGLLIGVSVPVVDNISRAQLRGAASKTSGMIKATYDYAVLAGKPCRL